MLEDINNEDILYIIVFIVLYVFESLKTQGNYRSFNLAHNKS